MSRFLNTLHGRLLILALAAMLPFLMFAATVVSWNSYSNAKVALRDLEDIVQALALAIDGRVQRWQAALSALATSPTLSENDFAAFYQQARTVAQREGGWVVVSLPSGEQAVNTRASFGAELPKVFPPEIPASILREPSGPHISDLYVGPRVQRLVLSTSVQAVSHGQVSHVLHLRMFPRKLSEVLRQQNFPPGWAAGIVDGNHRIIAGNPDDPQLVGEQIPGWLSSGSSGRQSGVLQGESKDHLPVYSAFIRLSEAPWMMFLSVPAAAVRQTGVYPVAILAAGGTVLLAGATWAFVVLGLRLTRPLERLVFAARAATRGEPPLGLRRPDIPELGALHDAVTELSHMQLLLRETNHRIKNSLQLVSATLAMQGRAFPAGEARHHFAEAQAHIQAIARLHERLYGNSDHDIVDAVELARGICADVAMIGGNCDKIRLETEGTALLRPEAAGPFALILAELVVNALKHAPALPDGHAVVRCRVEAAALSILVFDGAGGVPADLNLSAQHGLGLRMCLALASQIGATLGVAPFNGAAALELRVPLAPDPNARELRPRVALTQQLAPDRHSADRVDAA